jgi:glutathione peroxidase-family protein
MAYSSIAEVETSPLDILSIPCNKFGKCTDDGFEIECKKFLSNVWTISTEDRNKIEVLTRGQSNNKEWFSQRAGKLLITKLVSIPNIIFI